ncbi:MAG: S9 family peptidase, partial [Firmicutes bacterium]|nr:S9 family peptidase [Bacillota bacterium]
MLKKITASDLYEMKFLSEINYNKSGSKAVFTVNRPDDNENTYISSLWLFDAATEQLSRLTADGKDSRTMWEDDSTVLFSSPKRAKAEKDHTPFYRISIHGGEALPAFDIPAKVRNIKPVGNGVYALISRISIAEPKDERPDHAQIGVDFEVFDELPFWFNGEGITNKTRDIVQLFDSKTGELKDVTARDFKATGIALSPDGRLLAYAGYALDEKAVYNRESGLWLYELQTGKTANLIPQASGMIGSLTFWGDELFYTMNRLQFPGVNPAYCLMDVNTMQVRELPYFDGDIGAGVTTDASYGGGRSMKEVCGDMYMVHTVRDDSHLCCHKKDGTVTTVVGDAGAFMAFDMACGKILYVGMRDGLLGELYLRDLESGSEKQVSSFNKEYDETHAIVKTERFTFTNKDGWELDGFVLKPVGYESGKKYPGILQIHGGPKAVYSNIFHHEMQMMASRGYFVFFTNPRGGDGRGDAFADITGQLGGIDYEDLMEFTEEVLKRYPDIDQENLACCGGSYGGFMANWMVGHTTRFKAACAQRSISNYFTKAFTTDIGYYHNLKQIKYTPWEDFDKFWANSPLKNAPLAKAATLFIQSDEDYRCWESDAFQMYMAMRSRGV